jgi:inosine-uridine nucleoside N-ribohydrolase
VISSNVPNAVWFIDTDLGADDALAIAVAINADAPICMISTVAGNVTAERAADNVRVLLNTLTSSSHKSMLLPRIRIGRNEPLVRSVVSGTSTFGEDGLAGVTMHRNAQGEFVYHPGARCSCFSSHLG